MNFKRYLGAVIALFIFVFLYEWLLHGVLLTDLYHQTPQVWRTADEMMANMSFAWLIKLFLSAWIVFFFVQFFPEGGIANGLTFGIFLGVIIGVLMGEWYLWLPVSSDLAWGWLAGGIVEGLGGGFIAGLIYRR